MPRNNRRRRGSLMGWIAIGLVAAAVVKELSLPREDRTWHGRLMGIPYDFRLPTLSKIQERIWAPADERIFVPQVVGMGWTVNFGRLKALLSSRSSNRVD